MKAGDIYPTNKNGDLRVVEDNGHCSVLVEFLKTGYRKVTSRQHIKSGIVKDPCFPSVLGVAFLGCGKYKSKVNGKQTKAYETWRNMLLRCYDKAHQAKNPTYIGCSVCNDWLDFQVFGEWFYDNYVNGFELDKDMLLLNNKVYGPDGCVFIHQTINTFTTDRRGDRGDYLLGCYNEGGKSKPFKAQCSNPFTHRRENLGRFETEQAAHMAWKRRKHELACQLADSELVNNDERVAKALRDRYLTIIERGK